MTSAKSVVLTALKNKEVKLVKKEAGELADNIFCSKSYVLSIIRKVEKGNIVIQ